MRPERPIATPPNLPWRIRLICCGHDDGAWYALTWEQAEKFRDSYTSGAAVNLHGYSAEGHEPGHKRAGIIEENDCED